MIDTRGLSCPTPVLMTKKSIASNPEVIEVLVDNNTAKENVTRFLKNAAYMTLNYETTADKDILITAKR